MKRNPLISIISAALFIGLFSFLAVIFITGGSDVSTDLSDESGSETRLARGDLGTGEAAITGDPGRPDAAEIAADTACQPAPNPARTAIGKTRRTVRGKVVDARGAPIQGVSIVLIPPRGDGEVLKNPGEALNAYFRTDTGSTMENWPRTESALDGSFRLEASKSGRCWLIADSESRMHACRGIDIVLDEDPERIVIVLERGFSIEGYVVDARAGFGVGGVSIKAVVSVSSGGEDGWHSERYATSMNDGYFRFSGLPEGEVEMIPQIPYDMEYRVLKSFMAHAGDSNAKIEIWPLGYLEFTAVSELDGKPLEEVIEANFANPIEYAQSSVRLAGPRFRPIVTANPLRRVLRSIAGQFRYVLAAKGYVPVSVRFNVEEGVRTTVENPIVFKKGAWIEGSITLADPAPPAEAPPWKGAVVYFEPEKIRALWIGSKQLMDMRHETWEFKVSGFEPGPYLMTVLSPGRKPVRAFRDLQPGSNSWDIELFPRTGKGVPPARRAEYADRKLVRMSIDVLNQPLEETIEWLSVLTGARFFLDGPLEKTDTMVNVQVDDATLEEILRLVLDSRNLELNEATGRISRKKKTG